MRVVGINFSVDSAASLVEDGIVKAASAEERFTRIKHDSSFPDRALDFCLSKIDGGIGAIDAVAFFWNPGIHCMAPTRRFTSTVRHPLEFLYAVPTHLASRIDGDEISATDQILRLASGRKLMIHYVSHHMCHASAAFYTSPFEEAAIITVDGYGERMSTGVYRGRGNAIEPVLSVDFPHSIGSVYAAFTQYLGFRANSGEGKVMGLASYGEDSEYAESLRSLVKLTDGGYEMDLSCFEYFHDRPARYNEKLISIFGPPRKPESELTQRHLDIAWGVQTVTEEVMLHMAALARARVGTKSLCVAGGVGLNCVANGRLMRESGFENFYFYPASGDAGTGIGAALFVHHGIQGTKRSFSPSTDYLGPEYERREIEIALRKSKADYIELKNPEEIAASMIVNDMIIGWFQGRAEFGPRALGNRSILASPTSADMKDRINSRVKFREEFRPYAPSVLEEECANYFSCGTPSPFMLRAYRTLDDKLDSLRAITHVDGTARVQTVSEVQNYRYYELIKRVGEKSGVPVVLNTSFNIRGEPIVNTVEDALKCLLTTGLDVLFVGDFLVFKNRETVSNYLT